MGLYCALNVLAQNPNRQRDWEQIKAARIAFLTNRLDLNSDQAQKFWPVFNEYEKEKRALLKEYSGRKRALVADRNYENMTDQQASQMIDVYIEQKEAEAKIEKKYLEKFKAVLTPQQTWKVIRFEGEFRRSLMQRLGRSKSQDGDTKPPRKRDN